MTDLNEFARRYIAVWNEPDPKLRRLAIAELFAPDAVHYTPSQEVRGHAELEARITTAYEKWVDPGVYLFRSVPKANGHHNAVRFNWEMVTVATGKVDSIGFDFIVLDDDGRIRSDHQFVD
jgi:SnoaL-like domain